MAYGGLRMTGVGLWIANGGLRDVKRLFIGNVRGKNRAIALLTSTA